MRWGERAVGRRICGVRLRVELGLSLGWKRDPPGERCYGAQGGSSAEGESCCGETLSVGHGSVSVRRGALSEAGSAVGRRFLWGRESQRSPSLPSPPDHHHGRGVRWRRRHRGRLPNHHRVSARGHDVIGDVTGSGTVSQGCHSCQGATVMPLGSHPQSCGQGPQVSVSHLALSQAIFHHQNHPRNPLFMWSNFCKSILRLKFVLLVPVFGFLSTDHILIGQIIFPLLGRVFDPTEPSVLIKIGFESRVQITQCKGLPASF